MIRHADRARKIPNDELHGFARLLRDNTLRRAQEEALRVSESRLRALTESLENRVQERTAELAAAHERVRQLASEMLLGEQRVRRDIARRLHDDLQQHLFGVQLRIAALRSQSVEETGADVIGQLDEVERWVAQAVATARRLTTDLSPPVLSGEGLVEALGWLADQMRLMHGLRVELHSDADADLASDDLRVLVFQAVKELLFNIVKHATDKAAKIEVRNADQQVRVVITDGGPGFDVDDALSITRTDGFGLLSVLERLRLFGGDLQIDSAPGRTTRVTVIAPISVPAAEPQ